MPPMLASHTQSAGLKDHHVLELVLDSSSRTLEAMSDNSSYIKDTQRISFASD